MNGILCSRVYDGHPIVFVLFGWIMNYNSSETVCF